MCPKSSLIKKKYERTLRKHLLNSTELTLEKAYMIGREAYESGVGMLDIAVIHNEILCKILADIDDRDEYIHIVNTSSNFFNECLALYEMISRGFEASYKEAQRVNEELVTSNKLLEDQIVLRKKAQAELTELNLKLEDKVLEQVEALQVAHNRLIEQTRLATLGKISNAVAHEIRNSLGTLKNIAYFLGMVGNDIAQDIPSLVAFLNESLASIQEVVDSLLWLSKVDLPILRKIDGNQLIEDIVHQMSIDDYVTIKMDLDPNLPSFIGDQDKLQHAITNILKNALQAMPSGGKLTLKSTFSDDSVSISITDTGMGISEDVLEEIFEPLFTTKAKGLGLGLPIALRFIEQNKGQIHVTSEVGKGSTFSIILPLPITAGSVLKQSTSTSLP